MITIWFYGVKYTKESLAHGFHCVNYTKETLAAKNPVLKSFTKAKNVHVRIFQNGAVIKMHKEGSP
jgi:hypothetical protein